jgi:hypothetical protein
VSLLSCRRCCGIVYVMAVVAVLRTLVSLRRVMLVGCQLNGRRGGRRVIAAHAPFAPRLWLLRAL